MRSLIEDFNISRLNIKVNISDRIAVFFDDSATGKTYLFSILRKKLIMEGKKVIFVNSESMRTKDGSDIILNSDVVILDNADLYLTDELFERIMKCRALVLLSVKSIRHILRSDEIGYYRVKFGNDVLTTVRRNTV